MNAKIQSIIEDLNLAPHPEGGYFRETYRSSGRIGSESLVSDYAGERSYSTCIYFLLTSETFSAFHRIKQDEIWHFYDGAAIALHTISPDGKRTEVRIGNNLSNGETPQCVVSGGDWFAASVIGENSYALVGCTVAPGFNFADFELAERGALCAAYPHHAELITQYTRL